jgi:hypothetical protein
MDSLFYNCRGNFLAISAFAVIGASAIAFAQDAPPAPPVSATAAAAQESKPTDKPEPKHDPELEAAVAAIEAAEPDNGGSPANSLEEPPPIPEGLLDPTPGAAPTPTESVVVNLITRLVERGVLTQGDAVELVSQAQRDAAIANQNAEAARILAEDAAMATETDVVVSHVPEPLKEQMREEIKAAVLAQAREEGWAAPNAIPEWTNHFEFFGDIRMRYQGEIFPEGNDTTGSFPNFNRINTGDPFDVAGFDFSPQINVDEERHRFRLRARLGTHIKMDKHFSAGFRLGSGNDNSPVTTNQTLSGNFNRYPIWLDRSYIKWEAHGEDVDLAFLTGRFDNPFFRTSEIQWDNDLGFDGFAVNLSHEITKGISPFFNGGIFPIFNTAFNFPDNLPDKYESTDKWIYGAQLGVDLKGRRDDVNAKLGVAYYDFDNIQGELSEPFIPFSNKDAGTTDNLRPSFAQKGNTYMALRDIIPDPLNGFGTTNQWQYFGLASQFQVLSYNAKVDLNFFEPLQISLLGEYGKNLGFDPELIDPIAVNNRGPIPVPDPVDPAVPVDPAAPPVEPEIGPYEGGNEAWNLAVQFGSSALDKAGAWNAQFGYRYVESDAYVDGFTDSDFGLGGTNVEGFTASASFALSPNVNVNFRWMGANEIAGPPLKSDVIIIDLNANF